MSEELEALEHLNNTAFYKRGYNKIDRQGYLILKQALKRNEPMKVDLEAKICIYSVDYYGCPNCTGRQIEREYRYCPDCGQALDWSDDE